MQNLQDIKKKTGNLKRLLINSGRLFRIALREHPVTVTMLGLVTIVWALIPFAQSGVIALLINTLAAAIGGDAIGQGIYVLAALLIATLALPNIFSDLYGYYLKRFWLDAQEMYELMFVKKMGNLDIARLEDPNFNDLRSRAMDNYFAMINLSQEQFGIINSVVSVVAASLILLFFDPVVFFVVLIGTLPSFFVDAKYGQSLWGVYQADAEDRRRYYDIRDRFFKITELTELKLFRNLDKFFKNLWKLVHDFHDKQKKVELKRLVMQLCASVASIAAFGFAVMIVIRSVIAGETEIGTMTFVITSLVSLNTSLLGFLSSLASQLKNSLFVTDVFQVLDTPRLIKEPLRPKKIDVARVPEIVFEGVSFKYPNTDKYVLKDFNLRIGPGEKLAVVGVNGAGKTTFVKLLCRFYDPTEGRILVDGVDLRNISLAQWYDMLAVLFQDYATYHFLAKETIALGRSSIELDEARVRDAAEASDSKAFIEEWEKKYDQMIGKEFAGGVELSRGQQQKLALARSFYREPKVLILDEPTASVDAEAEAKIFERLEAMGKEATMIFISHRFSTVRKADTICVIEEGRISELGTHAELVANRKTYARLFELQAKGYKE